MKVVAVILAGGLGARSGFSRPKQLIKLGGRPVIAHTLERFETHPGIDEIVVVTNQACLDEIEALIIRGRLTKVRRTLLGGDERYASSLAAIRAYEGEACHTELRLLFHDAVRPLVSHRVISDVINALDHYGAVDVAIPATDTVIGVDPATNTIADVPDRDRLRFGQTPQGFRFEVIRDAYELGLRDIAFRTTDDCGVVLHYLPEQKIVVVNGEQANRKLTYADDLLMLDKLLQTGAGRRLEADVEMIALSGLKRRTIVVFGGTSGIGAAVGRLAGAFGANVVGVGRSTGVDIAHSEDVRAILDRAIDQFGRIDAVVNTAASLDRQPLAHMTPEKLEDSIRTNFLGAANIANLSYSHLRESRGHLLMFASSSYTYGRAFYSTYSASKAAVVNLVQALADEWADDGIKVNCVNPERTRTPMRVRAFGTEPENSLLDPDEVARKSLSILVGDSSGLVYDVLKT